MRELSHTYLSLSQRLLSRYSPKARISCLFWYSLISDFFYPRWEKKDAALGRRLFEIRFWLFRNVQSSERMPIRRQGRNRYFFQQREFARIVAGKPKVFWIEFLRDTFAGIRVLSLRTISDFLNGSVENVRQPFLYYLWAMLFCSIHASNRDGFSFSLRKGLDKFCKVLDMPCGHHISVLIGVK